MRILAVSQYYWPEPFSSTDICEELALRGHDVTILTGLPNYPEGELYPGYSHGHPTKESHNGVTVLRARILPRKRGPINRALNYWSFSSKGATLARKLEDSYDLVFWFGFSPVMSAEPAIAASKKLGIPLMMYVTDLWPESLLAGGISKTSPIFQHYANISKKIYGSADRLLVTSPLFESYLSDLLGRDTMTGLLPQYAEDVFNQDSTVDAGIAHQFPSEKVNLTFAGNIGTAQSVDTIIRAASVLKDDSQFLFHIVGSGSELESCRLLAEKDDLSNVVFHGRHPLEEMPSYYAMSDAMIATFSDMPVLGYTLPRKIQSYMAAGKPVIASSVGESKRVIDDALCGFCCEAQDARALAEACKSFGALPPDERAAMGQNARAYYEEHFSREHFFFILEDELQRLKGTKHEQQ